MALAGIVGFLGYGVSLALLVHALRHLRHRADGAYFSTAPFLGAIAAVTLLGEPVTVQLVVAGTLMAFGVWLHLTERHEHEHLPTEHAHAHVHDEHHRHAHRQSDPPGEPHANEHSHGGTRHTHPHMPDMHHTHRH
jgi:hypothetical protein